MFLDERHMVCCVVFNIIFDIRIIWEDNGDRAGHSEISIENLAKKTFLKAGTS